MLLHTELANKVKILAISLHLSQCMGTYCCHLCKYKKKKKYPYYWKSFCRLFFYLWLYDVVTSQRLSYVESFERIVLVATIDFYG